MANCVTCKARCENAGQHRVKTDCISYIPKDYPKPKTNADRIRAMTDEELTRFFAKNCGCDEWCIHKRSGACASKNENECCLDVWYKWLKSPKEE